jgi:hypothetical protein
MASGEERQLKVRVWIDVVGSDGLGKPISSPREVKL